MSWEPGSKELELLENNNHELELVIPRNPEQGCSGYAHMQLVQINSISIFAIIPSIIVIIRVQELESMITGFAKRS